MPLIEGHIEDNAHGSGHGYSDDVWERAKRKPKAVADEEQ